MDSGQGKAAVAALGVKPGRNGKVKAAAAASASSVGRGSRSAAAPFSVGRGYGSAAGLFPVRRGSGPAAPLFPIGGSNYTASSMAPSDAAKSSPIGSFTNHGGTFANRWISIPSSSISGCVGFRWWYSNTYRCYMAGHMHSQVLP